MRKTEAILVKIEPDLKRAAQEAAEREGIPLAGLIRGLLRMWLRGATTVIYTQNPDQGRDAPGLSSAAELIR